MKKFIIIIVLGLCISGLVAQVAPGYMGKRLLVEYSGSFAPAIFRFNPNGEKGFDPIPPEFNLPFNYGHKLSISYVLNRKRMVELGYERYSTGTEYRASFNKLDRENLYSEELNIMSGYGIVNSNVINLGYRNFVNGIAPLGKYRTYGLKLLFSNTNLDNMNFTTNDNIGNDIYIDYIPKKDIKTVEWGLYYGFGINRIIADKIVINIGAELALMLSALGEFRQSYDGSNFIITEDENPDVSSQFDVVSVDDYLIKKSSKRVFSSQFFNIKIGIGFLAY